VTDFANLPGLPGGNLSCQRIEWGRREDKNISSAVHGGYRQISL